MDRNKVSATESPHFRVEPQVLMEVLGGEDLLCLSQS